MKKWNGKSFFCWCLWGGGGAEKGLTMNTGMQGTKFAAAFGERLLFTAPNWELLGETYPIIFKDSIC